MAMFKAIAIPIIIIKKSYIGFNVSSITFSDHILRFLIEKSEYIILSRLLVDRPWALSEGGKEGNCPHMVQKNRSDERLYPLCEHYRIQKNCIEAFKIFQ